MHAFATIGGDLKGRSYIKDNCLAAMALINHGDEESEIIAVEILKNFSSIQNEDGSWYYFYDISGDIGKVSGKDYKESDTGYNALALQCSNDDDIGSAFLGSEEYVFKMVK